MSKIIEILGRWTCSNCGYEWSAMLGDNEIPYTCSCKEVEQMSKYNYVEQAWTLKNTKDIIILKITNATDYYVRNFGKKERKNWRK